MPLENERELIQKAQSDPNAFACIFEEYYDRILGYVLGRTGNIQIAEDITSEVFFKSFKNIWQFRWQGVAFSSWLYRIASNEIKRYFRSPRSKNQSLDELMERNGFELVASGNLFLEMQEAEEALQKHEDFLKIQKSLQTLPFSYQEVISLRFFEEKKIHEIAEILGKKEGTIKSMLSRGLEKLRRNADKNSMQPFSDSGILTTEE